MPLPLAPIAGFALRYGAVALAAWAVTRRAGRGWTCRGWARGRRDQPTEDALDDLAAGVALRRDGHQINATARFVRVVRLGRDGPGVEVDAAALGRVRLRRV